MNSKNYNKTKVITCSILIMLIAFTILLAIPLEIVGVNAAPSASECTMNFNNKITKVIFNYECPEENYTCRYEWTTSGQVISTGVFYYETTNLDYYEFEVVIKDGYRLSSVTQNDTSVDNEVTYVGDNKFRISITATGMTGNYNLQTELIPVQKYTVTIDANGGEHYSGNNIWTTNEINEGDYEGLSYIWRRTGHTPRGLSLTPTGEMIDVSTPYPITSNMTLYVYWAEITYSIYLNGNGGLFPNNQSGYTFTIPYSNNKITTNLYNYALLNCIKQGYYVKGIADTLENANNGQVLNLTYPMTIAHDKIYYVVWNKIAEDENIYSLSNMMYSIIDAPLKLIRTSFDLNVFGVNLSDIIITILSLCLVGFVIKKII